MNPSGSRSSGLDAGKFDQLRPLRDVLGEKLAELIRKTGAREIARREESGAVVVEMAVPQPEYAAFTRELAALGSLRIEGQPAEIPPVVRLSVRISQ